MIGGAVLEKIAGSHNITAGAPATFVGAFHKIEAGTAITLKCGASRWSSMAASSDVHRDHHCRQVSMTKAVAEM